MTNFAELAASVARVLGRDDAKKTAIVAANPEIFYAFDAAELGAMSAHEVAAETLKKRGVRLEPNENGVRMLEVHNMGVDYGRARARHGGASGSWGADASEGGGASVIEKYIRGEP
jgi:hypothetical protein